MHEIVAGERVRFDSFASLFVSPCALCVRLFDIKTSCEMGSPAKTAEIQCLYLAATTKKVGSSRVVMRH